jgi:hypothetical protein
MSDMNDSDTTSRELAMRFGAHRLCLWRLCGNRTCRRAQSCRGDPRNCMGLLGDWLEAIDAEKRMRGSFAPLESEIKTVAEARAYLAWRKALGRTSEGDRLDWTDPQAADRFRYELARRIRGLAQQSAQEK